MSYQLIYTSAAELLEPGQTGFGTVARSRGLSRGLIRRIENLCIYKTDSLIVGPQYTYRIIDCIGKTYHIFSRASKCQPDYTGRNNYIIHHIIFSKEEIQKLRNSGQILTPAGLFLSLLEENFWKIEWLGAPSYIEEEEPSLLGRSSEDVYNHTTWKNLTGHRSNANILNNPPYEHDCLLTIPIQINSQDILQLLNESDAMSEKLGWDKTFTSHGEIQDTFSETQRITVNENSPLENRARRTGRPILRINQELHLPAIERDNKLSRTDSHRPRTSSTLIDIPALWQNSGTRPKLNGNFHSLAAEPDSMDSLNAKNAEPDSMDSLNAKNAEPDSMDSLNAKSAEPDSMDSLNAKSAEPDSMASLNAKSAEPDSLASLKEHAKVVLISKTNILSKLSRKAQTRVRQSIIMLSSLLAIFFIGSLIYNNGTDEGIQRTDEGIQRTHEMQLVKEIQEQRFILAKIKKINREIEQKSINSQLANYDNKTSPYRQPITIPQQNESYKQALTSFKEILLKEIENINHEISLSHSKQKLADYEASIYKRSLQENTIQANAPYLQTLQSFKEILAEQYHPSNTLHKLITLEKELQDRDQSSTRSQHKMARNLQESIHILNNSKKGYQERQEDLKILISNAEKLRLSTHTIARLYIELNGRTIPSSQSHQPIYPNTEHIDRLNGENENSKTCPVDHSNSEKRITAIIAGALLPKSLQQLFQQQPCILEEGHIIASSHEQPNLGARFSADGEHLYIESIAPSYYRLTLNNKGIVNTGNLMQLYASDKFQGFLLNGLPSFLELSIQCPSGNEDYLFLPCYNFPIISDENPNPLLIPKELSIHIDEEDLLIQYDSESKQQQTRLELSETVLQTFPWKRIIMHVPLKEGQIIKLPKLPGFLKSELINIDTLEEKRTAAQALEFYTWNAEPVALMELLSVKYNLELTRTINFTSPLKRAFNQLVNKAAQPKTSDFYSIATLYSSIKNMESSEDKSIQNKAYRDYMKLLKNEKFDAILSEIFSNAPQYYLSTSAAHRIGKKSDLAIQKIINKLTIPANRKHISKLIREYIQDKLSRAYRVLSSTVREDNDVPPLQLELKKVEAKEGNLRWYFKLEKAGK